MVSELGEIDGDDFFGEISYWAEQAGVWDGRPITYENLDTFRKSTYEAILDQLFSQDRNSLHFQQMMTYLARAGSDKTDSALLEKDIEELKLTTDGIIIQIGSKKKSGKFWKKVAVGAVVVTFVIVFSASMAGAAGHHLYKPKKKKNKGGVKKPEPKAKATPPTQSSQPSQLSFMEHKNSNALSNKPDIFESFTPPEMQMQMSPRSASPALDCRQQKSLSILEQSLSFNRPNTPPAIPKTLPQVPDISKHKFYPQDILKTNQEELSLPQEALLPKQMLMVPSQQEKTSKKSTCRIGGINGIDTTSEYAEGHADYLKKFTGKDIEWVYNCTHGKTADIAEVFALNYRGFSPNTAKELKKNWTAFHNEHKDSPNAKYLQFCHSQGAIHVKNALQSAPNEIRGRVIVVAIAPGAIVSDEICYKSFNYASKKDIVYYGELISSSLKPGSQIEFIMAMIKQEKNLILLDPHPDAKGIDHDFRSPTFKNDIKNHIEEYLSKNGEYK